MRVLVAGGGGYVGSALVPELLHAGDEVAVLTRSGDAPAGTRALRADTRAVDAAPLRGHEAVIDLAAVSSDARADADPAAAEAINVSGALRLAEAARAAGCARLVFASTCAVYGAAGEALADEGTEPRPVSLYAKTKLRAERALLAMSSPGFAVVALRLATVHGLAPGMHADAMAPRMVRAAAAERLVRVSGEGRGWRPFVHVADAASAFALALRATTGAIAGRVFNVASENLRVAEVAALAAAAVPGAAVEHVPAPPDARSYRVSGAAARRALGWEPRRTLQGSVRELAEAIARGDWPAA